MGRHTTAAVQGPAIYDDCLISSCLKSLFTKVDKSKAAPAFVISDNIAELKKDLEQVNKEGVLEMSYPYLAAMERSIPGAAFRYAVIYEKGVPVLFGYFQLFTLNSKNFHLEKNAGFVKSILQFFLKLKKVKIMISGNAFRNESVCYCCDKDVLKDEEGVEVMTSIAEKIAAEENVTAIILKDVTASTGVQKWLTNIGYQMPWQDKVMTMDIDAQWESLSNYTAALSRKYKTRANKILAAGNAIQVRELSEEEVVSSQAAISKLFKNVADNQPFVLTKPGQDHFGELKKIYKSDFEVFGFFQGAKLVAFYSAFITADAYELYYVGFDYELNSDYQLYFNLLFSGLERAIVLRKKQLKLGRTSFDAKASIGAKPYDVDYFIKTANIPTVVSKWFANYFSSMEDGKWKLRNPLK